MAYATNIVEVVGGVYNCAKLLAGKSPQEISKVENKIHVRTNDGNVTIMDFTNANMQGAKIYLDNKTVRGSITKEFETLENDSNVTGFELLDKRNNTIASIEKREFADLAEPDAQEVIIDGENGRIITSSYLLQIKEQDWTFKKMWHFYMNGHVIKAKVKDQIFIGKVLRRDDVFAAGDSLDVLLDITQTKDAVTNVWRNVSYSVKEVKNHIKPPSQRNLF